MSGLHFHDTPQTAFCNVFALRPDLIRRFGEFIPFNCLPRVVEFSHPLIGFHYAAADFVLTEALYALQ